MKVRLMDETQFAIKMNNAATNDPCAVCGGRTDPQTGPELFLADSWAPVCRPCGRGHAPALAALLDAPAAALAFDSLDRMCLITRSDAPAAVAVDAEGGVWF